jgi:chemotaxis protein histidine kinase CheA
LRRDLVFTFMKDMGRQRVANFVVKKFQHISATTNQLLKEQRKNEVLTSAASPQKEKQARKAADVASAKKSKKKQEKVKEVEKSRTELGRTCVDQLEKEAEAKPESLMVAERAVRSIKKTAKAAEAEEARLAKTTAKAAEAAQKKTPPAKRKIKEKWSMETTPVPRAAEEKKKETTMATAVEEAVAATATAAAEEPMEVDSTTVASHSGITVSITSEFSLAGDRGPGGKSPSAGARRHHTFGVSAVGGSVASPGGELPPTYRQLKRANTILMAVRQHKVSSRYLTGTAYDPPPPKKKTLIGRRENFFLH